MSIKRFLLTPLVCLGACCGVNCTMYFTGVSPMNLNDHRESGSVEVLVLQLRDDEKFKSATEERLMANPKDVLKEDLLSVDSVIIDVFAEADGKRRTLRLGNLPGSTRFVGVLARFQKADDKGPRKLLLTSPEAHGAVFILTGYHILLDRP